MSAYIKTIVESPKRQLDRALGIDRSTWGRRPRAGAWQKIADGTPLRCGLRVFEAFEERHVGIITGYEWGHATVRWESTGWLSKVRYGRLYQATLDQGW